MGADLVGGAVAAGRAGAGRARRAAAADGVNGGALKARRHVRTVRGHHSSPTAGVHIGSPICRFVLLKRESKY